MALNVADVEAGACLIGRSKANQEGLGSVRYIASTLGFEDLIVEKRPLLDGPRQ